MDDRRPLQNGILFFFCLLSCLAVAEISSPPTLSNAFNLIIKSPLATNDHAATKRTGYTYTPRDFGARCDVNTSNGSGTDDTVALQKAIDTVEATSKSLGISGSTLFVHGSCVTGPLTITRPINIVGDGSQSSSLWLKTGSGAPLMTVSVSYDNNNYYANEGLPAYVSLKGMTITSQSGNKGSVSSAHGLMLTTAVRNSIYTHVDLDDVRFYAMPGDGLNGGDGTSGTKGFGANGFVTGRNLYFTQNGRNGLYGVANYDWRLSQVDFNESIQDNVLLSDAYGFVCTQCNSYAAGKHGLEVFSNTRNSGPSMWIGGAIDTAALDGVYYHTTEANTPFIISNTNLNNNGQSSINSYSDIAVLGEPNNLILNGVTFGPTHSVISTSASQWNINFDKTSNATISGSFIGWGPSLAFNIPARAIGSSVFNTANFPALEAGSVNVGGFSWARLTALYPNLANPKGNGTIAFGWNYLNGSGEESLFVSQGGGANGGFSAYQVPNASGPVIALWRATIEQFWAPNGFSTAAGMGVTAQKTIGSCTITISGGIITAINGC